MKSMQLPCDLTDADRLRIGEQLTAEIHAQEQVETAKKEATRGFNATLKEHKKSIHDFNESLRTGTERREVEVEERPDYEKGIVFVHRLDNGECVKQRAIDPDERQVKLGIDAPTSSERGAADDAARTDEQREAGSPEEAEALRAERLASERAERISAGVQEARERITVLSEGEGDRAWKATLQYGNRVLEAEAATAEAAANGVAQQVTEILEAQEDAALTMDDAVAASQAEQRRQELERLEAEQAADEASTPKRGFKLGLVAPKKKKTKHETTMPDGRVVDPEQEVLANESVPVDADGKPLAF